MRGCGFVKFTLLGTSLVLVVSSKPLHLSGLVDADEFMCLFTSRKHKYHQVISRDKFHYLSGGEGG